MLFVITIDMELKDLIGEATAYDKKERLEVSKPKSWLKSVSAFANGDGGTLVFGISSDVVKVGFVKESPQFTKEFTKEFVKAQRRIYKLISTNPQINITAIAENLGVSTRQVQKYLRRLTELHLITREGGRKNGIWKILDKDYNDFFERI